MTFRKQEESPEEKLKKHQGLAGNQLVQAMAFEMLDLKNQIEELNTDRKHSTTHDKFQAENALFIPLRKRIRDVLSLTEADIKDESLVQKIKEYLNKPYGTYPTLEMANLAQQLYNTLRKIRIIWISFEFDEDSTETKLNRW